MRSVWSVRSVAPLVCLLLLLLSPPATSISVLRFPPGKPAAVKLQQTTLNSNIAVYNLKSSKILNFETNEKNGFKFTVQGKHNYDATIKCNVVKEHYGFVNLKNVDLLFDYNFAHVPDSSRQKIDIFANSVLTFSKDTISVLSGLSFHEDLLSLITIGEAKAKFSQEFYGEFSKLYIWKRVLTSQEIVDNAEDDSLLFNWNSATLETGDKARMVYLDTDCPSSLNAGTSRMVGFGNKVLFRRSLSACYSLGGVPPVPGSDEDIRQMMETFPDLKTNCNNKFWVPVRQRNGRVWVSAVSGEPVHYQPWAPGQPNGGRHQACAEAKVDQGILGEEGEEGGSALTYQGYNDLNCAKSTRCFTCTIKSQQRFTLRGLLGLCGQNKVDTHFVININSQAGRNRPSWSGYRDWEIAYSTTTSRWEVRSVSSLAVVASYNGTALWPAGLNTWSLLSQTCSPAATRDSAVQLLLYSCSEDQLSCGDGSCLPLSSKCDGVVDCGDELDEQNCHLVEFPVSRIYHASLPPVARDNKQNIILTEVELSVDLINVASVKEMKMQFRVKFELGLEWFEPRLRWRDLQNNSNLNIIPTNNLAEGPVGLPEPPVWVPVVVFANTPNTDTSITDTKASLNVRKVGQHFVSTLDNVEQVLFYEGSENPINYRRKYSKDFSCDIKLQKYPFDRQVCKMRLNLPSSLEGLVSLQPGEIRFSGSREMLQFRVENWSLARTEAGLEVKITLQRIYHHHLYNTYIPTLCLMVICQATLYFNKEHFKTNVPVTITTMLVMYTLYMAVSNKLPPTSYIKLIDIWLIFGLTLPFTVFFLHVLIEHFPVSHQDPTTADKLKRTRDIFVTVGRLVLPGLILTFATLYFLTAALIYNNII